MNRREFVRLSAASASLALLPSLGASKSIAWADKPNFIVIFCDDLGYGDLGIYGHPSIKTPNLDRMAIEGQKWTNFYSAASVCTPSRAGILTGRYPVRSGLSNSKRRVLFPDSAGGLPKTEITIAEVLKENGYKTDAIGKWHLGHLPEHLPRNHGFDSYFGIPYSNDMDRVGEKDYWEAFQNPEIDYWNVPLIENEEVVERPANQHTITKRYTERVLDTIEKNKDDSFFIYLAHNLPHTPLFASEDFKNTSTRGLFGDVIEEIDNGVGRILDKLKELKLEENTLVVFTSDNGPWLPFREQSGSSGLLRQGKGSTWEGGMREPGIFWWPGSIQPSVVDQMGSTLDLLPTFAALSGASLDSERALDGFDLSPVLKGDGASPRDEMVFYRGLEIYAIRQGQFKAHFITQGAYGMGGSRVEHERPLLYHLGHDPSESYNIAEDHPEIIEKMRRLKTAYEESVVHGADQLLTRIAD